jgi:hypothetical protein
MAKCWRCGGGKTITMTTTGTHVLPCPTCGGSGELASAQGDENKAVVLQSVATAKAPADDRARAGSKVAERAAPLAHFFSLAFFSSAAFFSASSDFAAPVHADCSLVSSWDE